MVVCDVGEGQLHGVAEFRHVGWRGGRVEVEGGISEDSVRHVAWNL